MLDQNVQKFNGKSYISKEAKSPLFSWPQGQTLRFSLGFRCAMKKSICLLLTWASDPLASLIVCVSWCLISVWYKNSHCVSLTHSTHLLHPLPWLAPLPGLYLQLTSTSLSTTGPSCPHLHRSHSTDLPQPLCQKDGDQWQPRSYGYNVPFSQHQPQTHLRKQQGQHRQKGWCRQGANNQKDPEL